MIFVDFQHGDKWGRVIATISVEVTATNRMAQHATFRYFTCFELLTVALHKLPVVTSRKLSRKSTLKSIRRTKLKQSERALYVRGASSV